MFVKSLKKLGSQRGKSFSQPFLLHCMQIELEQETADTFECPADPPMGTISVSNLSVQACYKHVATRNIGGNT